MVPVRAGSQTEAVAWHGVESMARHDRLDFVCPCLKDCHRSHEHRSGRWQVAEQQQQQKAGKARPQTFRKHDMYYEKRMECSKLRLKQCL